MIKPKIGIYGRMNAGKSSLLNHIIGYDVSIVSEQAGTTTDPVRRSFEILDFAPVIFIDTAGFDDRSELGKQRVAKTVSSLNEVDLAIFVFKNKLTDIDNEFIRKIRSSYILVRNSGENFEIYNSGVTQSVVNSQQTIIDAIKLAIPLHSLIEPPFFGNRLSQGDIVLMVCPIDSGAPSGRLILPQIQAIRAALDTRAITVVVQSSELSEVLKKIHPKLIVTDSQSFGIISPLVPQGIDVTSFSILLAELKGDKNEYELGINSVDKLKEGDKILLIEHCTHQTSCDDIARVKIPFLLQKKLGINLKFEIVKEFRSHTNAKLVVQCGGCMVGRRSIMSNIEFAKKQGIPITNYGMLLKYMQ